MPKNIELDVKTFLYFIGFPRSGHSIVASFIDAHENAIIGDEFNFFNEAMGGKRLNTKRDIVEAIWESSWLASNGGSRNNSDKGYNLGVAGLHKKPKRKLKLVGEKSGSLTLQAYRKYPNRFKKLLRSMEDKGFEVKTLLVSRNPFDNIATMTMYEYIGTEISSEGDEKYRGRLTQFLKRRNICGTSASSRPLNMTGALRRAANQYRNLITLLDAFITDVKPQLFVLHISELIEDPYSTMKKLCSFLAIQCDGTFLEAIAKHTFDTESRSRFKVEWNFKIHNWVYNLNNKYPHFYKYFTFFD